ncbi:hypothetical protein KX729_09075 [Rhizobium sp. XQZ8]|uniref:hypothetical protein n=1 Tax=Rhizobium populisoli TaxID=2859785 RepID=UPI001CA4DA28|nr:hypothetical protein [Rhizobium populisoli]MBW6421590.1 hypothetical protein [Rhizobium populisoli]
MEIGGIGRNYQANPIDRNAASGGPSVPEDQATDPAYEKYDRLIHGLTKLSEATAKADDDAKARAKQKLKDAQEQLKFMQRWGMDPEVVARLAAQLGTVVAAAAREFADALGGNATGQLPTTNTAPAVDKQQPDVSTGDTTDAGEEQASQAERAYLDVMDDNKPTRTSSLSQDDIRTATEFSTIAKQIKALLEEAARNLREQRNAAAVPGTQNLDAAVGAVTNAVSTAPTTSITI